VVDVPTAHTPPGGYGDEMPAPILEGCSDPLPAGAPDLRGTWHVVDLVMSGERAPDAHRMWRYVERIEQCGYRLIVTGGGVVHDMVVDGTFEHGVNDVLAADYSTSISVAASFEDGALVLRPKGLDGVEVRRHREGDDVVWQYHSLFTARLARVKPV
jgi:hypothetical protein